MKAEDPTGFKRTNEYSELEELFAEFRGCPSAPLANCSHEDAILFAIHIKRQNQPPQATREEAIDEVIREIEQAKKQAEEEVFSKVGFPAELDQPRKELTDEMIETIVEKSAGPNYIDGKTYAMRLARVCLKKARDFYQSTDEPKEEIQKIGDGIIVYDGKRYKDESSELVLSLKQLQEYRSLKEEKPLDLESEKAIAQFIGFREGEDSNNVIRLAESMGLTRQEYESIRGDIQCVLKRGHFEELDSYYLSQRDKSKE